MALLDKRDARLSAIQKTLIEHSTYKQLDKISFGIVSGYYGTNYSKLDKTGFFTEKTFVPVTYIPVMGSFQHNFSTILGEIRHISTQAVIPYEEPETNNWTYSQSQLYAFYRVSAGLGLIQEHGELNIDSAPVARFEVGFGSRDSLFSWINTSIGYQRLFTDLTTFGSLFINWSLTIS